MKRCDLLARGHEPGRPAWRSKPKVITGDHICTRRRCRGSWKPALRRLTATIGLMHESLKLRMAVIELWPPKHLDAIVAALDKGDFVEFGLDVLVVHRRRGDDEPPR